MGSAASIQFKNTRSSFVNIQDGYFQALLSSKAAREELFEAIASHNPEDRIECKDKISLKKLVWYFTEADHQLYPGFAVNVPILNEAFKYTLAKKNKAIRRGSAKSSTKGGRSSTKSAQFGSSTKSKKPKLEQNLNKKLFHEFLPVLLLFTRLWGLFDSADKLVVEDQRIFKHEFYQIQECLGAEHGIAITGGKASRDAWDKEFALMDRNNDGYIEFDEACAYAIKSIKEPFEYGNEEDNDLESDKGSEPNNTPREQSDVVDSICHDEGYRPLVEVMVHEISPVGKSMTEHSSSSSESQHRRNSAGSASSDAATVEPSIYLTPDYGATSNATTTASASSSSSSSSSSEKSVLKPIPHSLIPDAPLNSLDEGDDASSRIGRIPVIPTVVMSPHPLRDTMNVLEEAKTSGKFLYV